MSTKQKIPEGWKELSFNQTISQVIDFRGKTPKKLGMDWGGSIPALSANNVKKGYIDFNSECHLASEELYEKWMNKGDLKQGDIVFTMEAPLGNVAIVPDNNKYILSQRVVALRPSKEIDNNFLFYYMLSEIFQGKLDLLSTGSTAKGINQKSLSRLKFLIPTLVQQRRIVQILETWDKYLKLLEKKIELKKRNRNCLLQQLINGEIRLRGYVENWTLQSLGDACDINPTSGSLPETFVYIDLSCVNKGVLTEEKVLNLKSAPSRAQRILKRGDVLFQMVRPYQKNNLYFNKEGSYVASTGYAQIRTSGSSKYIYYLVHSNKFVNAVLTRCTGSNYPAINSTDLSSIRVKMPKIKEQHEISNVLTTADNEIFSLEKTKLLIDHQKKYLLNNLITGQIRVPEFASHN